MNQSVLNHRLPAENFREFVANRMIARDIWPIYQDIQEWVVEEHENQQLRVQSRGFCNHACIPENIIVAENGWVICRFTRRQCVKIQHEKTLQLFSIPNRRDA